MGEKLNRLVELVKDFLFPMGFECLHCGTPTWRQSLCPDCLEQLRQERLPLDLGSGRVQAYSVFTYMADGVARRLVTQMKAESLEEPGFVLGQHMAAAVRELGIHPQIITWVPMSALHFKERGMDHSRILAEEIGHTLGIPVQPLLCRAPGENKAQHTLSRQERFENAARAFQATESKAARKRHILLVDDVYTTGATARRCAGLLLEMGARQVTILTATRRMRQGVREENAAGN